MALIPNYYLRELFLFIVWLLLIKLHLFLTSDLLLHIVLKYFYISVILIYLSQVRELFLKN